MSVTNSGETFLSMAHFREHAEANPIWQQVKEKDPTERNRLLFALRDWGSHSPEQLELINNTIIYSNLGFAALVAHKAMNTIRHFYAGNSLLAAGSKTQIDPEDVLGCALEGMAMSAKTYDPQVGSSFPSYASLQMASNIFERTLLPSMHYVPQNLRYAVLVNYSSALAQVMEKVQYGEIAKGQIQEAVIQQIQSQLLPYADKIRHSIPAAVAALVQRPFSWEYQDELSRRAGNAIGAEHPEYMEDEVVAKNPISTGDEPADNDPQEREHVLFSAFDSTSSLWQTSLRVLLEENEFYQNLTPERQEVILLKLQLNEEGKFLTHNEVGRIRGKSHQGAQQLWIRILESAEKSYNLPRGFFA